ncbi:MAG: hypothetical protein U1E52_01435 [Geminicoccaceae bacterium]
MPGPRQLLFATALLGAAASTSAPQIAQAQSADQAQLRQQIEALKRQLAAQQKLIDAMQQQMDQLQAAQVKQAETKTAAASPPPPAPAEPVVTSGSPRMRVAISGQVDRLLNLADDGKSTKAYFVDNNVSVSRIRLAATGQISEDLSAGTNMELAISPNNSGDVSQVNEDGSQKDEFRKVEALLQSRTWGDVFFGKGDPATKDIARMDLSGTDVLAYASTGDPAGGLLFRTKDGEDLTSTNIGSVFVDFDQGRTNRIRYDTPKFQGAFASASYGADQKWGVAGRWAGIGHGLKAAAGIGIQDPSKAGVDVVYAGSASVLHDATGLSLTYGTAWQKQDEGTGQLQYVKAGWQHSFFSFGKTAFSIDFGYDKDAPGDGDDGKTIGFVALQSITDYGTDLFAGFRSYDFDDGNGPSTSTIYVGTMGTRVKF